MCVQPSKKKGRGVKLVLGGGMSVAEQRRQQALQQQVRLKRAHRAPLRSPLPCCGPNSVCGGQRSGMHGCELSPNCNAGLLCLQAEAEGEYGRSGQPQVSPTPLPCAHC